MLAPKNIDEQYIRWNERWHAPAGHTILKRFVPRRYRYNRILGNLVGMFGFQPNNSTRKFEYPWAFDAADLKENMTVLDLGGGFSGFPFVLSKLGMKVINVDPFFQYGPTDHYKVDPYQIIQKMNRIFGTSVSLERCVLDEAKLADASFDRIFCVSVIEHLSVDQAQAAMKEAYRLLKPNGLFVLTIDLFLNLVPFSKRRRNDYGMNISVRDLVENSGFGLLAGKNEELFGYAEFDVQAVLANLEKYFIGNQYPALIQTLVLKKDSDGIA